MERELIKYDWIRCTTNPPEDYYYDYNRAQYEILQQLAYDIVLVDGVEIDGEFYRNYTQVLLEKREAGKINKLCGLLIRSPEGGILVDAIYPDPESIEDVLSGADDLVPPSWIQSNRPLIERALKLSYLRAAEDNEFRFNDRDYYLQEAEKISEPDLDPEGIRLVMRQRILEILDQHPELRP